jgi:NADH-quinone oxidoreductase subunit M
MPLYISFFFFFTFANISFPGTAGFLPEFLIYLSSYHINIYVTILISLGILLLPFYFLLLLQKISFGSLSSHFLSFSQDINFKEFHLLFPLFFLTFLFGLFPQIIINDIL